MERLAFWQKGVAGVSILILLLLYLPIVVMVVFSFNKGQVASFPLTGFTLAWYEATLNNEVMIAALFNSLVVAFCATLISVVVGTAAAIAIDRHEFPGKRLFQNVILLPLSLPGIVTGIAMLSFYKQIGIPLSLMAVTLGHATAFVGIVVSQLTSRLDNLNRNMIQASQDLGATPIETLLRIVLPNISRAIFGSALLCFTLSFDDIAISYFLTGREITLPMYIYSTLRRGITPEINAIGTVVVLASIALIAASIFLLRDRNKQDEA